jgi:hypothetical protein
MSRTGGFSMSENARYITDQRGGEDMNTHPDIRVALARSYLAEVLERARQEEIRRSVSSRTSESTNVPRRRLTRRARVPQEAR